MSLFQQKHILLFVALCLLLVDKLNAQDPKDTTHKEVIPAVRPSYYSDHDTNYYRSFERYITARFFFSQKYAGLELERAPGISRFQYVPNTPLAVGVGVTYQSISINIGYALGFLQKDVGKGRTRYLDIQTHVYGRQWTIDLLGQFYKGYYLTPKGLAATGNSPYYKRPDLRVRLLGISAYRSLNPSKFSFRSALLENEQQKKSAGSLLLGAEIYYGVIKGDSSFVPAELSESYLQKDIRRLEFIKIGPGIGYAYTYIITRGLYITGALCASLSLDFSNQHGAANKANKVDVNKGFIYRIATGYDSNNWNVNLSLVGNQMTVAGATTSNKYILSAGNLRLTLAKRIKPGKWLSRKLHPVDKVIENVKGLTPTRQ